MTLFDQVTFQGLTLRVRDKDANIAFYQETLGLTLLREENALALFGSLVQNTPLFSLEESPDYRTRAVDGPKKLAKIIIKAQVAQDIEQLLAKPIQTEQVFLGQQGYAFEARSPQGDLILIHAEDDVTTLKPIEQGHYQVQPDFKGLTDYHIEQINLHVADPLATANFYQALPLTLDLIAEKGPDLTVNPAETWDLEILEFKVAKDYDLKQLADYFADKGTDVFLDKKETILVVSDPSQIEVWFQK